MFRLLEACLRSGKPCPKVLVGQNPSEEERNMMKSCLNELQKNPQITPIELVYKCNITSELVARNLNLPELLQLLSRENG